MLERESPPLRKWVWQSIKPGRTSAPSRSMTRVFLPTSFLISAVRPTRKIRSPSTAAASAQGREGSAVQKVPFKRTVSGTSSPGFWQDAREKDRASKRKDNRKGFIF